MEQNKKTEEKQELEQKKEEFLEKKKEGKKPKQGPPIYLLAMVLLLGLLGGYAISIVMAPPTTAIDEIPDETGVVDDTTYRTVQITMLYSDDCKSCRKTNTIEELFVVRGIPYKLKTTEINSEEGKKIINRFDIESVPTAIVNSEEIKFYPNTKKNFDNLFEMENNAYVIPELNLNENFYYAVYFLEKVPALCLSEKPSVIQFDDYYTIQNTKGKREFYDFTQDFNENTDFKYIFAQAISNDNDSIMANLFLTCAGEQGKYLELERQINGIYCNNPFNGDETILTQPEINGCQTLSEHFGTPLSQFELDVALGRTNIDVNSFVECINKKEVLMNNAKKLSEELGINRTGTFLLDCQETTTLSQLKDSFCTRHQEINACEEETPDEETAE